MIYSGGLSWKSFVTRNIESWEELAKVWILNLKRGGVIYYERLVHDTESELRRLLKMLSISSVDEERMDCVLRHKDDTTFKRKPTKLKYTVAIYLLRRIRIILAFSISEIRLTNNRRK